MPAAYAHYRFGKEVLSCLHGGFGKMIKTHRELFDIGVHGPDILFYYHPPTSNPITRTGHAMHRQPASLFFRRTAAQWKDAPGRDALEAYLYGFVCHFALDSVCHPYIQKMIHESGFAHNEIETELERYFMQKDGIDPYSYVPVRHIRATAGNAAVIAPCFPSVTPAGIKASLKGMRLSLHFLHVSSDRKRQTLYRLMQLSGQYDSLQGLVMKPETDPLYRKYCERLDSLYAEAVPTAVSLIRQYAETLRDGSALSSRFDLTFGAGKNWRQLIL